MPIDAHSWIHDHKQQEDGMTKQLELFEQLSQDCSLPPGDVRNLEFPISTKLIYPISDFNMGGSKMI